MAGLSERIRENILSDVEQEIFVLGEDMPAEAELAQRYQASRLTVREAVRKLCDQGVIEVHHGKRNRVALPQNWSAMEPDVMMLRGRIRGETAALVASLMESREVIEVSTVRFAAQRITEDELRLLDRHLSVMEAAFGNQDPAESAEADLEFHKVIIAASRNEFLAATYEPLEKVLRAIRLRTSSVPSVRADAIYWHRRILEALEAHDADAAVEAMRGHMAQTREAAAAHSDTTFAQEHFPSDVIRTRVKESTS